MKLVIFGANGPVGKLLTELTLDGGHDVSAVTRHPGTFPLQHERLRVVKGDVLEASDVSRAVVGHDAVLSLFGVRYTRAPVVVYSQGTANILSAMRGSGVRRIVCVTSGGTSPGFSLAEGIIFGVILKRIIGRTLYADMRRMEQIVMASDRDWTIVRPARLVDAASVSAYRVEEAYHVPGMTDTARIDLADMMLKEVVSGRYLRKAVAVATPGRSMRASWPSASR